MIEQLRELQQHGRCADVGSRELFFSERPAELAKAQRICTQCQIRVRFLDVALQENLEWGVWGGVIFWDGQPYHRRRGRGRPSHAETNMAVKAKRSELLELVKSA